MQKQEHQTEFDALIPELPRWNGGKGVEAEAWIGMLGKYELAVGYSLLFWPRFVEFERYVLRHDFSEDALRGFEKATAGDRSAVEAVMNHVHLRDIHCNDSAATELQLRYLGRILKNIHEVKLRADYPERRFVVSFNDEPGLDLRDYQLSFWQSASS